MDITSQDFVEKVLHAPDLVIVDFSIDSSETCQIFNPELEAVSKEFGDRVTFFKLDVEQHRELTDQWNVDGIPTLIFFRHGQEINRIKGVMMREKLRRQVAGAILEPPN